MKINKSKIVVLQVLVFIGFISLWESVVHFGIVSDLAVAPPSQVFPVFLDHYYDLFYHLRITVWGSILGFFCGAMFSFSLAILIIHSDFLAVILYPYIIGLKAMSKVAIAILFILIFGHGIFAIVAISALISFFPLMNNLITGLRSVDPDLLNLFEIYKANKLQIFLKARLPSSLPYLFAGLKSSVVLSVKGALIGEIFLGVDKGLGFLVMQGNVYFDIEMVYAAAVLACAVGIIFYMLISFVEKRVLYWHESMVETI